MRKSISLFLLILCFGSLASAQNYSKVELFGGYQYASVDAAGYKRYSFNGWDGAATGYFSKHFGVTADFAGNYHTVSATVYKESFSSNVKLHTFLFGPTVRFPKNKFTPFAHVLIGKANLDVPIGDIVSKISDSSASGYNLPAISYTPFAFDIGGGVDIPVKKRVSVRVGQFDYLMTNLDLNSTLNSLTGEDIGLNSKQNHFRYSAGVVFKW